MTANLHHGITYQAYCALPGLRWTDLKLMALRTPRHFRHALSSPERADSDALKRGRLVHQLVLGGSEEFIAIGDRRTKEASAALKKCVADGSTPISQEDFDAAHAMRDAIFDHGEARELLDAPGANELSITWDTSLTPCKARIDRYLEGTIVDLKTTRDASEGAFARDIASFGYHGQMGSYTVAFDAMAQYRRDCRFIVVEKDPPHCVVVYTLRREAVLQGRELFMRAVGLYQQCADADDWPGLSSGEIDLPKWSRHYE